MTGFFGNRFFYSSPVTSPRLMASTAACTRSWAPSFCMIRLI